MLGLLDLFAAFDMIDHIIPIDRLRHSFGIQGVAFIVLDRAIHLQQNADNQFLCIKITSNTWCTSRERSRSCAFPAVHGRPTRHCPSSRHWHTFLREQHTTISSRYCWLVCRQRLSRGVVHRRFGLIDVQQSAYTAHRQDGLHHSLDASTNWEAKLSLHQTRWNRCSLTN